MIVLTRLNGPSFALNPDLIERVEADPDTVVVLIGGAKYPIAESVDELLERVRDYRGRVIASAHAAEFAAADFPPSDKFPPSSTFPPSSNFPPSSTVAPERALRILPTPSPE